LNPVEFRNRFALATFDDGGVLIDVESGGYFQLNGAAVRVCRAISAADDTEHAVGRIAEGSGLALVDARALVGDVLTTLARSAPSRGAEGPFSYVKRANGYALLYGTTVVLRIDERGDALSIEPHGTAIRLSDCLRAIVPKILALQGTVVLHASAVSIDGRTIAFSGPSGAGKTTTAKALARGRADLVSEDLLVIVLEDDGVSVVKGSERGIRQWQAEAEGLLARRPDQAITCQDLHAIAAGPREPLTEIMFISADRRGGEAIGRTPLPKPEALRLLLENSFLGSAEPGAWRQHLTAAHRVARTVPACAMTAPNGLDGLLQAALRYTEMTAS
jgi:hypothetical protein